MRSRVLLMIALLGGVQAPTLGAGQDARSELLASLARLDALTSYRLRMTMTPGTQGAGPRGQMTPMGTEEVFKPVLHEVVNPDRRRAVQEVAAPTQLIGWHTMATPRVITVSQGPRVATYLESPEMEREAIEGVRQYLVRTAAPFASAMVSAFTGAARGGPVGMLAAGLQAGLQTTQAGIPSSNAMLSLNRWTCQDLEVPLAGRAKPPIKEVAFLGTGQAGPHVAKLYRVSLDHTGPRSDASVTVFVSASSGLPIRLEMSTTEGGIAMEYYDFDAPITIALPDCLK